jgi:hypothetical protein
MKAGRPIGNTNQEKANRDASDGNPLMMYFQAQEDH